MAQQVLLYTRALPTRLAVEDAFAVAQIEPVKSASPTDLLEKLQQGSWDVVVLDGDSSPVPLPKLLPVVLAKAGAGGTVVLVLSSQAEPSPAEGDVVLYNRPIRRLLLLGALNRTLLARGKKPFLPSLASLANNQRRALRVPLLVPVSYYFPALHIAWTEAEAMEVSISGARIAVAACVPGVSSGQILGLRNLLTGKQAVFRVVWMMEEVEGAAVGAKADQEDLRFWLAG